MSTNSWSCWTRLDAVADVKKNKKKTYKMYFSKEIRATDQKLILKDVMQ